MIVFITNPENMTRVGMISDYKSLIWTERWGSVGDFEMVVIDRPEYRRLKPGNVFELGREGTTAMMLETTERIVTATDRLIKLKGRSIEIVADYVFLQKTSIYKGSTESCAHKVFDSAIHYDNGNHAFAKDLDLSLFISFLGSSGDTAITYKTDDTSVLKQYHSLLSNTLSGYRVQRSNTPGSFNYAFDVIADRPRENDKVFLSVSLDDFESFSILKSISTYRNLVYVRYTNLSGQKQYMVVTNRQYRRGTELPWELGRRMYILDYTAEKYQDYATYADFTASLVNMADRDLAEKTFQNVFDGKLNPVSRYSFPRDYKLGDLVPVLSDSEKYTALITEYIISATTNSIEEYPTLQFMSAQGA